MNWKTLESYESRLNRPCDDAGAKPPPLSIVPLSPKLVDWSTLQVAAQLSIMPKEGEMREQIIEDSLWGYVNIMRKRNIDRFLVLQREIDSLVLDEGEERRFLEEDAHELPLRLFLYVTNQKAQNSLFTWEKNSRASITETYHQFSCVALVIKEEVDRMQISMEALDSCFLKLCQVNPFWMWRKLQFLEDMEKETTFKNQRQAVYHEEKVARKMLIDQFNSSYALALETFVWSEKQYLYQRHAVIFFNTCRELLEESAISIQAAFRGFQVRRQIRLV